MLYNEMFVNDKYWFNCDCFGRAAINTSEKDFYI